MHLSRMGIIVLDRGSLEVLDRLAVNMIRRCVFFSRVWVLLHVVLSVYARVTHRNTQGLALWTTLGSSTPATGGSPAL